MPSPEAPGVYAQIKLLESERTPFVLVSLGRQIAVCDPRRELLAAGFSEEGTALFHCPVRLMFGSSRPHEIALGMTTQPLSPRARLNPAL